MKNEGFIEFIYYDESLKRQDQFKFLNQKYKDNIESIKELKHEKIVEIDKFLGILDVLEGDIKELKKSLPTELESERLPDKPLEKKFPVKKVKKVSKKIIKKTPVKNKATIKQAGKKLSDLRLGLEKIKDELSRM